MLTTDAVKNFEESNSAELRVIRAIWVGKEVLVTKENHPHYLEKGTVLSFELTNLGKPALRVKGTDNEFFVFHPEYLKQV